MRMLARVVCVSAFVLAPIARIGADDTQNSGFLFDQVREAIPKLKSGMSEQEWRRLLKTDKLRCIRTQTWGSALVVAYTYEGFDKKSQQLDILSQNKYTITGAILRDGGKIVAEFDAFKK